MPVCYGTVKCVVSEIHDRRRRWSWSYMKQRREDRLKYIELFKQQQQRSSKVGQARRVA